MVGLFERDARSNAYAQIVFGALALGGAAAVVVAMPGIAGTVLTGLLLALGLYWSIVAVGVMRGPWRHSSYDAFGARTPDRLVAARAVEAQLAEPQTRVFARGKERIFVTREWLVSSTSSVDAIPLRDIVWVYPKTTSYSVNFLPLGQASATIVYSISGIYSHLPLSLPVLPGVVPTDTLLDVLAARTQATLGYRPEWANHWSSVRAGIIAEHARRQAAVLTRSPQSSDTQCG